MEKRPKMKWILVILLMSSTYIAAGQTGRDTLLSHPEATRLTKRVDVLPAISYSPETKLTLGVIGYYYLDLAREDMATRISNINFLAVVTTAKQIAIETEWDLFTDGNKWRFRGQAFYNKYPDRNYGLGNSANTLIAEVDNDLNVDTFNYLRFNSDRILFAPAFLRKVKDNIYIGLRTDMEYLFNEEITPREYYFLNEDSSTIQDLPVAGLRSGAGVQFIFDTRTHVLNPIDGFFVEATSTLYTNWLGSDFKFSTHTIDLRKYINPVSNHTLALRMVQNWRFSEEGIPIRALSRVGGTRFIRGYFKGTYQDYHLTAFELEYRLPFWSEENVEPNFWKMWKRLGVVVFGSASQVYGKESSFGFSRFHYTAGAGLRILFNRRSRANLRIDYAFGLAPHSNGPGQKQTGLYFRLAEAF